MKQWYALYVSLYSYGIIKRTTLPDSVNLIMLMYLLNMLHHRHIWALEKPITDAWLISARKDIGLWYSFLVPVYVCHVCGRRLNLWSTVICHTTRSELFSSDKRKRIWNQYIMSRKFWSYSTHTDPSFGPWISFRSVVVPDFTVCWSFGFRLVVCSIICRYTREIPYIQNASVFINQIPCMI